MENGTTIYKRSRIKKSFLKKLMHRNTWNHKQRFFCLQLFSNLLEGGFSIEQSLAFMEKLSPISRHFSEVLAAGFNQGGSFAESFQALAYSKSVVSQIEFGEIHGKIQEVLRQILMQQTAIKGQKEKLMKIASYPVLLLFFLFGICIVLKEYLIPQMQGSVVLKENLALTLVNLIPSIFAGGILASILVGFVLKAGLKRMPALKKVSYFSKVPFIKTLYIQWITIELSREWGRMFETGLEMKEVLEVCAKTSYSDFFSELSKDMEENLMKGVDLIEQVESFDFVEKTMKVMILSGDVKGTLGSELLFYSELLWTELLGKIERKMIFIQPLVFLFIAVMVIGLYSAFLLPIYESMSEMF